MTTRIDLLLRRARLQTELMGNSLPVQESLPSPSIHFRPERNSIKFYWPLYFNRYLRLEEYLDYRDPDLEDFVLTRAQHTEVEAFLPLFNRLHSITVELQRADITMSEMRALFDDILDGYPQTGRWISPDGDIVVLKVLNGYEAQLTAQEKDELRSFMTPVLEDVRETDAELSYAQKIIQRTKSRRVDTRYIDLTFVPPTSCEIERLFSTAKRVYSESRRSMLPVNLEADLFFKAYRKYWDKGLVSRAIKNCNDSDD